MGDINTKLSEIQKLYQTKRYDIALLRLNKLIKSNRENHILYNYVGIIYNELKDYKKALASFQKSIEKNKNFAEAYSNLGLTYRILNDMEKAKKYLLEAANLENNNLIFQINLANLYLDNGDNVLAINTLKKMLKLNPAIEIAHKILAEALIRELNYDEAIVHHKKALFISPNSPENLYLLAVDNIWSGNNEDAKKFLEKAIQIDPHYFKAYFALSRIKKISIDDKITKFIFEESSKKNLVNEDLIFIHFTLFKIYHNADLYDQAFYHLELGNSFMKLNQKFDINLLHTLKKQIKNIYTNNFKYYKASTISPCPIFIVGMPRAGSSLLEQILSGSTKVFGAGEINEFNYNINKIDFGKSNIASKLEQVKKLYEDKISRITDKPFVIDKLPLNFFWLGFIKKMLPNSKIIHIFRDPIDNCFSILNNLFVPGTLEFAYSQTDIIDFYNLYKEMLHFWNKELDNQIYNISYEKIILNPKDEIKEICNFIGVEFNENMLNIEKNQRIVRTASDIQVRGKIDSQSIKAWRRYKKHINQLIKEFKYEQ